MVIVKKSGSRSAKANSLIKHELGNILRDFLSEEEGLVTISRVQTSKDLRWAKVWISILGGNDQKILKLLQDNIYHIQGQMNRRFTTKILPRLQFFLDTNPRYAQYIDELIKKIHEEKSN